MSAYRLLDHELAALDTAPDTEAVEDAGAADAGTDEAGAEPDDEHAEVQLAVPHPRDLGYSVRRFDAALLVIDAAETVGELLALPDLLAARDRALHR